MKKTIRANTINNNNTLTAVQRFWLLLLIKGSLSNNHEKIEWKTISFKNLYGKYEAYAQYWNEGRNINPSQFSRQLNDICPDIKTKKVFVNKNKRQRVKIFPPLDKCRKEFEKFLDMEGQIEWEWEKDSSMGYPMAPYRPGFTLLESSNNWPISNSD